MSTPTPESTIRGSWEDLVARLIMNEFDDLIDFEKAKAREDAQARSTKIVGIMFGPSR